MISAIKGFSNILNYLRGEFWPLEAFQQKINSETLKERGKSVIWHGAPRCSWKKVLSNAARVCNVILQDSCNNRNCILELCFFIWLVPEAFKRIIFVFHKRNTWFCCLCPCVFECVTVISECRNILIPTLTFSWRISLILISYGKSSPQSFTKCITYSIWKSTSWWRFVTSKFNWIN